jgi:hypothetical protein
LQHSMEVMLFEKVLDVGKATKFSCKNFFYAKWLWELLNVSSIIVIALVFDVSWRSAVWMQYIFHYVCVPF